MSVSFKFLSSAWLLGIPREQLLSKRQNLPKTLGVQRYLCWWACASFLRQPRSREAAMSVGGEGLRLSARIVASIKGND